ncbi:MAG TPA: PfkB family carbohydrate kinase [Kofleriaceae bacterium]|nr:PfkB family carbohydrate kinase [Kofleriaceae bacterium]
MGPGGDEARFTCWGEVLWDHFPDGRRLGGAPANVAYHLAVLGAKVALISRVGDDEAGRAALAQLGAAGVDVAAVQVDPARPTGSVGVELVDGEPRYTMHPGCAWEHIAFDDRARAQVTAASALCFGTLSQRQIAGRAALASALESAPDCLAVCDLNLRPGEQDAGFLRRTLAAADLVKINQREESVLGQLFGQPDVVDWLCRELGASVVAVTRGADGCRLVASPSSAGIAVDVDQPGFPVDPGGDSVGCGDAFTAALALGVVRGAPLDRVAEAACRYAALVAGRRGAMPAMPGTATAEIRRALAAVRDEKSLT